MLSLDTPTKAFQRLKTIFEGTDTFDKAASAIAHLRDIIEYVYHHTHRETVCLFVFIVLGLDLIHRVRPLITAPIHIRIVPHKYD